MTLQTPTSSNGRDPESLSGFVRLLAHELGNPVATIRMSAEMLSGGASEEIHEQLVEILLSESGRLQALIESAVYFTSLPVSEPQVVDLEQILGAIVQRAATETPVQLRVDSDCRQVSIDAAQISRAISELLHNALEAGATNVEIHAKCDEENLLITVTDDGEGVSSDKISAIFDPFYTTREGQLGLGLSIARRIAQQHDGTITVRPGESGATTEASIRIPATGNSHVTQSDQPTYR